VRRETQIQLDETADKQKLKQLCVKQRVCNTLVKFAVHSFLYQKTEGSQCQFATHNNIVDEVTVARGNYNFLFLV